MPWERKDTPHLALEDEDDWQTESSFEDSPNPSSECLATAYMMPKRRQTLTRVQKRSGLDTYRLHNRVIRFLCISMTSGIILFIILLIRASQLENAAIANGLGKARLGPRPGAPPPPPPRTWDSFLFLKRYYGGVRTLVSLKDNVPEYPSRSDGQHMEHTNVTVRGLPESKAFPSYAGAGLDADISPCFMDGDGQVKVPSLRYYEGRPSGFPDHIYGSYEVLGLPEDICFERYGKLGPYGLGYSVKQGGTGAGKHGDQEGAEQIWAPDGQVDYSMVDWSEVQKCCYRQNAKRFRPMPPKRGIPGFYIDDDTSHNRLIPRNSRGMLGDRAKSDAIEPTTEEKPQSETLEVPVQHENIPRSALVLRCWDSFSWREEDVLNVRSLISELSLASGGRYDVHLLVQVKDDSRYPVLADEEIYRQRIRESVPKEFQGIATLWTVTQMLSLYQGVYDTWLKGPELPIHGVYRGLQMAIQHFSVLHPEYEYFWHWEMDLRYTGHYLDFLTKTEKWAREQPRNGLWERNERFYFPSVHGTWDDFSEMARKNSANMSSHFSSSSHSPSSQSSLSPQDPGRQEQENPQLEPAIWGPLRPTSPSDVFEPEKDPVPPESEASDSKRWGVGEEADLITFSPIFNPSETTWGLRDDITGYSSTGGALPPRRAHIVTASRMSKRLLRLMHLETAHKKHFAFSEMWPATVALHHGLKAVYAPHPVFVDRAWPPHYMSSVLNNGLAGAVGGAPTSVYGDGEHNLLGVSFFYNAGFGRNLWERWLGLRVNNDGGEGFETTRDERKNDDEVGTMKGGEGRMCLPPVLVHPVRDVGLDVEIVDEGSEMSWETNPEA